MPLTENKLSMTSCTSSYINRSHVCIIFQQPSIQYQDPPRVSKGWCHGALHRMFKEENVSLPRWIHKVAKCIYMISHRWDPGAFSCVLCCPISWEYKKKWKVVGKSSRVF